MSGMFGVKDPRNGRVGTKIVASDAVARIVIQLIPHRYGPDVEKWQTTKKSGSQIAMFGSKASKATKASHETIDGTRILIGFRGTNEQTN